jgi:hypothetical protein
MPVSLRTASEPLLPVRAESSNPWTIAPSFARSPPKAAAG